MAEVLSQNEIDNLLNAYNSGELDVENIGDEGKHSVKEYDFARPSKFAKEHLRTLEMIFEDYSRLLSTELPAYLRSAVSIEVANSEAISFQEFSNALTSPVVLSVINAPPLKGNLVMDLSVDIGYSIIDRILGGKGEVLEKKRDFSEIERVILEKILVIAVELLRKPWENVLSFEPKIEKVETNSQFVQIIAPNEICALISLSIKIGKTEGFINFCIPYITIEPVLTKLNTKHWFSTMQDKNDEQYQNVIENIIEKAQIPVTALLGKSTIAVNDFINIQVGDIIKLDKKIKDDLDVYVGNMKKFTGKPGMFNDVKALKITSIIREED